MYISTLFELERRLLSDSGAGVNSAGVLLSFSPDVFPVGIGAVVLVDVGALALVAGFVLFGRNKAGFLQMGQFTSGNMLENNNAAIPDVLYLSRNQPANLLTRTRVPFAHVKGPPRSVVSNTKSRL